MISLNRRDRFCVRTSFTNSMKDKYVIHLTKTIFSFFVLDWTLFYETKRYNIFQGHLIILEKKIGLTFSSNLRAAHKRVELAFMVIYFYCN